MQNKRLLTVKIAAAIVVIGLMAIAGALFREHRVYKEPVVVSEGCTEVKKLSDYSDVIEGTVNDCNVYIFDSGKPGGSILIWGRSHPEEPCGPMAAVLMAENLKVNQGRVFIIDSMNNSASTNTRVGEAYPRFFTYDCGWGTMKWRFGDRCANQLDAWPDPEVYIHYPSKQNLANVDVRNINRTWPGKENGLLSERTCYAVMQMVEQEHINYAIDFHEAELEYSVENCIVAHQNGIEVATIAGMNLTGLTFDVPIKVEYSPTKLHGLSHREMGDHSDCVPYTFEVAEPMLDRIRGITDEALLMEGKDRFVIKAGEHGLLYAPIDENGWPIEKRVARHIETVMQLIMVNNMMHPDQTILVEGIPSYEDMCRSLAPYYYDPATAPAGRLYYD